MLLNETRKNAQSKSASAMEATKDLFLNSYLPSNRYLTYFSLLPFLFSLCLFLSAFHMRPFNNEVSELHLVLWYIEDQIKTKYNDFISIIEVSKYDSL